MHVRHSRLCAGTLAAFLCLIAADASAQSEPSAQDERARLHFESGAAYYESGEYENALREFQSAYDLSHRAALNFNIYLCHQAIGDLEAAEASLARFLSEVEEVPQRDVLERRLENLRERIRRRAEGQPDEDIGEPEPTLEQEPSEPTTPPSQGTLNVPAIIGFSVAAVGVVGAAIFGPLTIAEDSSIASSACGMAATCTGDDLSTLRTYALMTDISLGVALAGAAAGTLLFFLIDTSADTESAGLRVAPMAGPGLAGVTLGGAL